MTHQWYPTPPYSLFAQLKKVRVAAFILILVLFFSLVFEIYTFVRLLRLRVRVVAIEKTDTDNLNPVLNRVDGLEKSIQLVSSGVTSLNDTLNANHKEFRADLLTLQTRVTNVTAEQSSNIDHVAQTLKHLTNTVSANNTSANSNMLELGKRIAKLETDNTSLNTSNENLRQTVRLLDQSVSTLDKTVVSNEKSLMSVNNRVSDQQQALLSVNRQVTAVNDQVTSVTERVSEQQQSLTSVNSQVTSVNNQVTSVTKQLSEQQQALTSVSNQVTSVSNQVTSVNKQASDQQQALTSVTKQVSAQQRTLTSVNDQLKNLDNQAKATGSQVSDLQTKQSDTQKQVTSLQQQSATLIGRTASLENQSVAYDSRLLAVNRRFSDSSTLRVFGIEDTANLFSQTVKFKQAADILTYLPKLQNTLPPHDIAIFKRVPFDGKDFKISITSVANHKVFVMPYLEGGFALFIVVYATLTNTWKDSLKITNTPVMATNDKSRTVGAIVKVKIQDIHLNIVTPNIIDSFQSNFDYQAIVRCFTETSDEAVSVILLQSLYRGTAYDIVNNSKISGYPYSLDRGPQFIKFGVFWSSIGNGARAYETIEYTRLLSNSKSDSSTWFIEFNEFLQVRPLSIDA